MKLAVSVPGPWRAIAAGLTDLDVLSAPELQTDPDLTTWAAEAPRAARRVRVLLNEPSPFGPPLPVAELTDVVTRVHPTHVISAHISHDAERAYHAWLETKTALPDVKVGVTLTGRTPDERTAFLTRVSAAPVLVLPAVSDRYAWLKDLLTSAPAFLHWPPRFLLVGVTDPMEAIGIRALLGNDGRRVWVESSVPRDLALCQLQAPASLPINDVIPSVSPGKLLAAEQLSTFFYNLAWWRQGLR